MGLHAWWKRSRVGQSGKSTLKNNVARWNTLVTEFWTYSHHCQIADMKPSKGSWNGEFRGVCICVGWISTTRFVLWVFICPTNIILFHGYQAEGYHAPSIYHRLPRRGLPRPIYTARVTTPLPPLHSYHACVYIPATTPRATTPHLYHHVSSHPSE